MPQSTVNHQKPSTNNNSSSANISSKLNEFEKDNSHESFYQTSRTPSKEGYEISAASEQYPGFSRNEQELSQHDQESYDNDESDINLQHLVSSVIDEVPPAKKASPNCSVPFQINSQFQKLSLQRGQDNGKPRKRGSSQQQSTDKKTTLITAPPQHDKRSNEETKYTNQMSADLQRTVTMAQQDNVYLAQGTYQRSSFNLHQDHNSGSGGAQTAQLTDNQNQLSSNNTLQNQKYIQHQQNSSTSSTNASGQQQFSRQNQQRPNFMHISQEYGQHAQHNYFQAQQQFNNQNLYHQQQIHQMSPHQNQMYISPQNHINSNNSHQIVFRKDSHEFSQTSQASNSNLMQQQPNQSSMITTTQPQQHQSHNYKQRTPIVIAQNQIDFVNNQHNYIQSQNQASQNFTPPQKVIKVENNQWVCTGSAQEQQQQIDQAIDSQLNLSQQQQQRSHMASDGRMLQQYLSSGIYDNNGTPYSVIKDTQIQPNRMSAPLKHTGQVFTEEQAQQQSPFMITQQQQQNPMMMVVPPPYEINQVPQNINQQHITLRQNSGLMGTQKPTGPVHVVHYPVATAPDGTFYYPVANQAQNRGVIYNYQPYMQPNNQASQQMQDVNSVNNHMMIKQTIKTQSHNTVYMSPTETVDSSSSGSAIPDPNRELFANQVISRYEEASTPKLKQDSLQQNVTKLAKTQTGSRFLQKELNKANSQTVSFFLEEIGNDLAAIMIDNYGNYFCQKLLSSCSGLQRLEILRMIQTDFVTICCDKRGTHTIQTMFDLVSLPDEEDLIRSSLKGKVKDLSMDQQGTHVIQKVLICKSFENDQQPFIFNEVFDHINKLSTSRNGLCVVNKLVQKTTNKSQQLKLIDKICQGQDLIKLVSDPFGNYAITKILQYWGSDVCQPIFMQLQNKLSELSIQKYSSNVIERCLERADSSIVSVYIKELASSDKLHVLIRNPFGNYVVQSALRIAEEQDRQALISSLLKSIPNIHDRKIRQKWEKIIHNAQNNIFGGSRPVSPLSDFSSAQQSSQGGTSSSNHESSKPPNQKNHQKRSSKANSHAKPKHQELGQFYTSNDDSQIKISKYQQQQQTPQGGKQHAHQ